MGWQRYLRDFGQFQQYSAYLELMWHDKCATTYSKKKGSLSNALLYTCIIIVADTLVRELIIANPGHWDMSYIFGILRSVWIQNSMSRIRTLPSPGEIRILNSGKIRIFAGFYFSGLKPIQIDGQLNFEWKIGITLDNWSSETGNMIL